jgi:peptidoglycan hydrolase-like protein with peptidoglycan-binding domain
MKNFVLFLAVAFLATSLIGCNKKKQDEASMDGLNGVSTENMLSLTDPSAQGVGEPIPVIVENAPDIAALDAAVQATSSSISVSNDKPSNKAIQQALKNAGLYKGKIDGEIGPKTKKAIETFQSQNNLKMDGKVGAKTWKAMSAYLNKPEEVANPSADSQAIAE